MVLSGMKTGRVSLALATEKPYLTDGLAQTLKAADKEYPVYAQAGFQPGSRGFRATMVSQRGAANLDAVAGRHDQVATRPNSVYRFVGFGIHSDKVE